MTSQGSTGSLSNAAWPMRRHCCGWRVNLAQVHNNNTPGLLANSTLTQHFENWNALLWSLEYVLRKTTLDPKKSFYSCMDQKYNNINMFRLLR